MRLDATTTSSKVPSLAKEVNGLKGTQIWSAALIEVNQSFPTVTGNAKIRSLPASVSFSVPTARKVEL